MPDQRVREGARAILASVKAGGDAAVREANGRFGGGRADGSLLVSRAEMEAARDALPPRIRAGLEQMIENIRRFAETQRPETRITTIVPGVEIERRWAPLARVGVYAPGGSAAYPSSLLMGVVPARVAGVGTVVVASPADAEGGLNQTLLGAAALVGVDVFIVAGGAQAVGAMAYGLPELGVAAGGPHRRAGQLLGHGRQAGSLRRVRHRPAGRARRRSWSWPTAPPTRSTWPRTCSPRPSTAPTPLPCWSPGTRSSRPRSRSSWGASWRRPRGARSWSARSRRARSSSWRRTATRPSAFVNDYAPEHLSVVVDDVEEAVARLRNAGSLFVGPYAPESAGDYASGANHVLPTGGLARSCGALSTEDYGKFVQVQRISREGLAAIRDSVESIAEAEGLIAHKRAVEVRFEARP